MFKADGTDHILTRHSDAGWGGDVSTGGSISGQKDKLFCEIDHMRTSQ